MVKKSFTFLALMLAFCLLCRAQETAFGQLTIIDDVCQISSPTDLVNFSVAVNDEGHKSLSAVLTVDIDMDGYSNAFQPIGTEGNPYCGTFDGQFHKISNLVIDKDIDAGFFSIIRDPALIQNVTMDNTCTIHCGSTDAGFVGKTSMGSGDKIITIRNIGMEATITIDGWCGGGILGVNFGTWAQASVRIENCYMTGDVNNGIEHNCILVDGVGARDVVANCWASGQVNSLWGSTSFASISQPSNDGHAQIVNCYTLYGDQVTMITEDQIGSGELCFMLNGSSFSQLNWYQTLGVDEHPVTDPTHGIVYYFDGAYHCITDDISFQEFLLTYVDEFIYTETEHCDELPKIIADSYREGLKELAEVETLEEFLEVFKSIAAIKETAAALNEAYAAFQNKVNEILAILAADNSFEGEIRDALECYLTVYEEPSEQYPDGTAPYILAQRQLTKEQVVQHMERLDSWLAEAIEENAGADVDLVPDEDGFYNISTPKELIWFAEQVNGGLPAINGRLIKDINMAGNSAKFQPIGTEANPYSGTFDGQFHKISNLAIDKDIDAGFFSVISDAVIQNVIMDKTCTIHCGSTDAGFIGKTSMNSGDVIIRNIGMEATVSIDGWCGCGILGNSWAQFGPKAGAVRIENCYVTGDVNKGVEHNCIIMDGVGPNDVIVNCWASGNVNAVYWPGSFFARISNGDDPSKYLINCYTLNGDQVTKITEEQIKSGELCFLLNGDQTKITWYQTIGVDEHPTFDPSHGVVYTTAPVSCDGVILGEGTFTNDASQASAVPEHDFQDGKCINCGAEEKGRMELDEEGFYNISNEYELVWFAKQVNSGSPAINGRLTEDIDMTGISAKFQPMGTENYPYCGNFDGQFHKISNLAIDKGIDAGFFSIIRDPALIENVIMDKTCTIHCGSTDAGFIGKTHMNSGAVTIRNIGMEATITIDGWCGGGIIGVNYGMWGPVPASVRIENCYMTGDVNNGIEHNCIFVDGLGAYDYLVNSWASGNVNPLWGGISFASIAQASADGHNQIDNCYSVYGDQVTAITEEQIKSGELCYLLNGDQSNITWYQTIGVDAHPTFIPTHGKVIKTAEGGYTNDDTSIQSVEEEIMDGTIYNVFGQKVQDMNQRGIYIINGKKVLVK